MSTEVAKPVETTEVAATPVAPVVAAEPVPAVETVEPEAKPEETVEPKAEETPKVEGESAEAAAEEKKDEKPVEPIYSGALGYKAPGLKNIFRTQKKHFWLGEEAAVPSSNLSTYLRGEKAEIAHPTAAWASVTAKGLLLFVKNADQKEHPAGVLNLSEASDLAKDGAVGFHFKLHGDKHAFEASTAAERNGWFVALEKAIEDAKAAKEDIVSREAYKEEKSKLGMSNPHHAKHVAPKRSSCSLVPASADALTPCTEKPTSLAPGAAATTPKKSTDAAVDGEAVAPTEEAVPARTGSSSSADEDKKKKAKNNSRSVSRGNKRASIFGSILGKKEKAEEKKEEKVEEKDEAKKEDEAAPVAEGKLHLRFEVDLSLTYAASTDAAAPVITEEAPKPIEDKAEETPATEEKKVEEKPKPTKRTSIFGNFAQKLKSPTHEKKESELTPVAPETEVSAEAPKLDETPKLEDAPLASVTDAVDGTSEAPKTEEAKPANATTPAKEKQHFSFGKFLGGGKEKVKSPTTEKGPEPPKTAEEAPKLEETPAVADATEPAATEAAKEEPAVEGATATPAAKKRASIFGGLGGSVKKEKDGEEKPQGLKGLFRNASKAGKAKKEKEPTNTPAKVEETAEPTEEKTEAAAPAAEEASAAAPVEEAAIGDVAPDAVAVGQAPKSTPAVTSSA
ncbi:hypothetical protein P280DRAFT_490946 [Massarina eburnea CBS 473.64]|uniref:Meiotic expression up-regulated protein 6 PH domain-containing protein n=1 Tax=Massarina eburnea CBS 473.64 TaxID=1395130 RepID=A0A6A6RYF7_9PLEO|nr:hypothetical protein P280DRAFT_490946 [Massarina eburnea CBS 473.64]